MRFGLQASEKWAGLGTKRVAWMVGFVVAILGLTVDVYGLRSVIYGQMSGTQSGQSGCSDGWYITGYFVPREDELPGDDEQIEVQRVGTFNFSSEFLNYTRTEGWGITRFGWALGYYGGGWHRSDSGPLDASGKPLSEGVIAIDRSLIPSGAQVQISTLPSPWGAKTFRASDVGVGIDGHHIDVFTGTGSAAEQETFRITSENNRVCVASGR